MMTFKKMIKETPKHKEMVIIDDPHIGIGLNTVPEPSGFYQNGVFDADDPPGTTPAASTTNDSMLGQVDDDVLVRFKPRYIGKTPEISSVGHFDEETGFIGSKTVKKKLFLDHTVTEPSDGRNKDGCPGFESKTAATETLNDLNKHCNHRSCNQNCVSISCGSSIIKNTPSGRDFVSSVDNKVISKVDCSHIVIEMVKEVPTYGNSGIGDCGISDLLPAGCVRMAETVMMHQGIFENAFAEEWIEQEKELQAHSEIIDHVIKVCDFPGDSVMVKHIYQMFFLLGLMKLENSSLIEMMVLLLKTHPC
jgi:hypothetical protein